MASRTAPSRPRGMGTRAPLVICSSPALSSRTAARLTQSAARRRESGLFLAEGARLCADAARSGVPVRQLF